MLEWTGRRLAFFLFYSSNEIRMLAHTLNETFPLEWLETGVTSSGPAKMDLPNNCICNSRNSPSFQFTFSASFVFRG